MSRLLFQRIGYKRLPPRVNPFASEAPNLQLYGTGRVAPSWRALYRFRRRIHVGVIFYGACRRTPLCKRCSTLSDGIIQRWPSNTTGYSILRLRPYNMPSQASFLGMLPNMQFYGARRVAPSRRALYSFHRRRHLDVMFYGAGRVIPLYKTCSIVLGDIIQLQS